MVRLGLKARRGSPNGGPRLRPVRTAIIVASIIYTVIAEGQGGGLAIGAGRCGGGRLMR